MAMKSKTKSARNLQMHLMNECMHETAVCVDRTQVVVGLCIFFGVPLNNTWTEQMAQPAERVINKGRGGSSINDWLSSVYSGRPSVVSAPAVDSVNYTQLQNHINPWVDG